MAEINVLSLSYGKDSLACLGACEQLGIPINRIVHAEVWATDEISADLPPMVEFKKKADAIIKERWGLEVEHVCAMTTPEKKHGFFQAAPLMGGQRHIRTALLLHNKHQEVRSPHLRIPLPTQIVV